MITKSDKTKKLLKDTLVKLMPEKGFAISLYTSIHIYQRKFCILKSRIKSKW